MITLSAAMSLPVEIVGGHASADQEGIRHQLQRCRIDIALVFIQHLGEARGKIPLQLAMGIGVGLDAVPPGVTRGLLALANDFGDVPGAEGSKRELTRAWASLHADRAGDLAASDGLAAID